MSREITGRNSFLDRLGVKALIGMAGGTFSRGLRARIALAGLMVCMVLSPGRIEARDGAVEGLIVQIPSSITTESTGRLRSLLHGPLTKFAQSGARQGGKFVLLCDFNPEGRRADSEDFGACYGLATFLRSLNTDHPGVRTLAYIQGEVRRHSVLPALACNEIVFSEKGRLGPVARQLLPRAEQTAYEDITRNRYPTVLIRKLFDPNLEVARSGGKFVEAKGLAGGEQLVGGLSAGEPAIFTFPLARDVGLCQQMSFASLEEVRTAYGLPRLGPQQSLDRAICWRIPLEGQVNGEMVEQTKRRVDRALRARANLLIFELKCSGGSSDKAAEIGQYLASLRDRPGETPVETIAFVTTKARNLATFIAFGCNKIVMQLENPDDVKAAQPDEEEDIQVHEARLGGFGVYMNQHPTLEPIRRELSLLPPNMPADVRDPIEARLRGATAALEQTLQNQLGDIAEKQRYPVVLTTAMFNREQRIHWVERAKGAAGGRVLLSELEFQEDQRGPRLYREVSLVKPWQGQARFDHRYLTLTAQQAREIGVSQHTVKDFTELCEVEGLISDQVKTAEADWLDSLGDFLRDPWTSVILVMIGITCLILELKMPGVGLPGVLSAICFVLFFWAHSQLHGQITWLAILLFLLGLLLLGLEIFIIPGFGVCGISGVLLVLASLGLVAYGHWPRTGTEWVRFGNQISPFGISMIGSLFLVFLIVRYLPNIPVLNRLMLQPLDENGDHQALDEEPMNSEYHRLLGAIGHAATPLRPAGKMQVEGRFVDVMAEGAYIMAGARVQVIEIEGNRVVVKEV